MIDSAEFCEAANLLNRADHCFLRLLDHSARAHSATARLAQFARLVSQDLEPSHELRILNDQCAMDRCVTKDQIEAGVTPGSLVRGDFPSHSSDSAAGEHLSHSDPRAGVVRGLDGEAGANRRGGNSSWPSSPHVLEALKIVERGNELYPVELPERGLTCRLLDRRKGGDRSWTQLTYRRSRPSPAR